MTDMSLYIGGVKVPLPDTFQRTDQGNAIDIMTLGNTVYTDFINVSRTWKIGWNNMLYADYVTIRNLFFAQFNPPYAYPYLSFPSYNIYTQVRLDIVPANLALNGVLVQGFSMTLRESTAVS